MPYFRLSKASFIGFDWYPLPRALISDTEQNTKCRKSITYMKQTKANPNFIVTAYRSLFLMRLLDSRTIIDILHDLY